MEEEDIEKAVMAYLRKKGYTLAEQALQEEQSKHASSAPPQTDLDIAKQIITFSEAPAVFVGAYEPAKQKLLKAFPENLSAFAYWHILLVFEIMMCISILLNFVKYLF